MKLLNSVAIVTGGGRGIGRAIAQSLAAEGSRVWICSRTASELEQTAQLIRRSGGNCLWRRVDVTQSAEIDGFVSEVFAAHGQLDVVVGNAGSTAPLGPLESISDDDYRRTISSNLDGLFYLLRATLPVLKRQDHGWVVAISSGAGLHGHPGLAVYSAANFAVQGMMQALAMELEPTQIRNVTINPGGVATRLLADLFGQGEADKQQAPEVVAAAVIQVLTETHFVPNGGGIRIRGGKITETYSR